MSASDTGRPVAIITGASSGIGAATAETLSATYDLVLGYNPEDPRLIHELLTALASSGANVIAVDVDVSRREAGTVLVQTALERFSRVDAVIACAGIAPRMPTLDMDDEDWRAVFDVNLLGVFRCFQSALPQMMNQGHGRLIATSSIAGPIFGWRDHVHYTSSKAALLGLVKGLAIEFGQYGITVNAVVPGIVDTPQSSDPRNSLGPKGLASVVGAIPVGRIARAGDIAETLAFLASDAAAYVTGQGIVVDGGLSINYPR